MVVDPGPPASPLQPGPGPADADAPPPPPRRVVPDGERTSRGTHFAANVDEADGEVAVAVSGELSGDSAPALWVMLERLVRSGSPPITVDLGDVTFFDSAGLRPFIRALDVMGRDGAFHTTRASVPVRRVLEATGLGSRFGVAPSPDGSSGDRAHTVGWRELDTELAHLPLSRSQQRVVALYLGEQLDLADTARLLVMPVEEVRKELTDAIGMLMDPARVPVIGSGDPCGKELVCQIDLHGPSPCAASGQRLRIQAGERAPVCPDCGWAVTFHVVA